MATASSSTSQTFYLRNPVSIFFAELRNSFEVVDNSGRKEIVWVDIQRNFFLEVFQADSTMAETQKDKSRT
jgi:hypothetical protein